MQYLLLFCVLEADLSTAQTISEVGLKKRGGGWGYTAQDVAGELQAMPVRWWYNWGNGIPDPTAQAETAVRHLLGIAVEESEVLNSAVSVSPKLFLSFCQQASGIDFVPMTYGNCCGFDDLPSGLPENATELLGFNEPNHW